MSFGQIISLSQSNSGSNILSCWRFNPPSNFWAWFFSLMFLNVAFAYGWRLSLKMLKHFSFINFLPTKYCKKLLIIICIKLYVMSKVSEDGSKIMKIKGVEKCVVCTILRLKISQTTLFKHPWRITLY